MKLIHKVLLAVLILMLLFVLWFYAGATLRARASVAVARAADYPEAFEAAASLVHSGAAYELFSNEALETAENYVLVDASVNLHNFGPFPAEWLEVEVQPGAGDVAVYSVTGGAGNVPAFGSGRVNVKLIVRDAQAERGMTLGYYVRGMHRTIEVPLR